MTLSPAAAFTVGVSAEAFMVADSVEAFVARPSAAVSAGPGSAGSAARSVAGLDGIWLDQHLLLSGSEPAAAEWGLPVPPRVGALSTTGRRGLRRSRPRTRQVHNRASRAHSW